MSRADILAANDKTVQDFVLEGEVSEAEVSASVVQTRKWLSLRRLRLGFSVSFAVNGYVIFPVWLGGVIIQWGRFNGGAHDPAIAFPIAFPSACLVVVPGPNEDNGSVAVSAVSANGFNASQLDGKAVLNSSSPFYWLALGH
ncbi:hypothetical protein PRtIB026_A46170 [Pseudomonas sp. RtIB026]|uniref:gp53-like domain-containing protein n=1 Tax=Pseudomonas sp. RtIB026 TaxID=2749999 RepID=UPI0019457983|nr:hypothetical protein [Pseudomonas sp. RtIB026]BCJ05584.1 hypothetical protein PRtIB026_A46170 [Pseudomonas sp. RtIB026]